MKSSNNSKRLIPSYIMAVLSMVFWGFTFVWTKDTLQVYKPITIITIRLLLSSVMLMFTMLLIKQWEYIQKRDIKLVIVLAFFSPFLYFLGETYGINNASSTVSSVIISTIPIFASIASYFVLKEKLGAMNFIGMIISFCGLLMVVITENNEFAINIKGVFWLMLAVFSSVTYMLVLKRLTGTYKPLTIVAYQNLIGFLLFLPLFFLLDFNSFITINPSPRIYYNILMLSIFGSSLAFIFYTYGTNGLGVARTSFFANLIPIFTAITAYIVLGEKLTPFNMLGIVVVIIGLTLAQKKRK